MLVGWRFIVWRVGWREAGKGRGGRSWRIDVPAAVSTLMHAHSDSRWWYCCMLTPSFLHRSSGVLKHDNMQDPQSPPPPNYTVCGYLGCLLPPRSTVVFFSLCEEHQNAPTHRHTWPTWLHNERIKTISTFFFVLCLFYSKKKIEKRRKFINFVPIFPPFLRSRIWRMIFMRETNFSRHFYPIQLLPCFCFSTFREAFAELFFASCWCTRGGWGVVELKNVFALSC